jgi:hypothetical protein
MKLGNEVAAQAGAARAQKMAIAKMGEKLGRGGAKYRGNWQFHRKSNFNAKKMLLLTPTHPYGDIVPVCGVLTPPARSGKAGNRGREWIRGNPG